MKLLAFALALSIASQSCFAQEVGSPEAYQALAQAERRAAESQAAWNAGKKLSVTPIIGQPKYPKENSLSLATLADQQIGTLARTPFKVLNVVDDNNCLLICNRIVVWLKHPTKDLVDDQNVYLLGSLKVSGTKNYEAVSGASKSVFVLEFLPAEEQEKLAKAEEKAAFEAEWPLWKSKNGTEINAKFSGFRGGVQLLKPDGKRITVQLKDFAEEDQKKLRELIKAEKKTPKNKANPKPK